MTQQGFYVDWFSVGVVCIIALALIPLWRWRRGCERPRLRYSQVATLAQGPADLRSRFIGLPRTLFWSAVWLMLAAVCDPHLRLKREPWEQAGTNAAGNAGQQERLTLPVEGVGLYLLLDVSGSMDQPVSRSTRQRGSVQRRIDLLKQRTKQFIHGDTAAGLPGRWSDMIGLVTFARTAHLQVPLTLDHTVLISALDAVQPVSNKEQDGTAIGYAVYKTASIIEAVRHYSQEIVSEGEPAYEMHHNAIVVVTDGLHRPNPADLSHQWRSLSLLQAGEYASEHDIRVYVINIEPAILLPEYQYEREQLQAMAEMTGGKLLVMTPTRTLESLYQEIDRIERGRLPGQMEIDATIDEQHNPDGWKSHYRKFSFAPVLLLLALLSVAVALLLKTTIIRVVP